MNIPIITTANERRGQYTLPVQFGEAYRPDLIQRAFASWQSWMRQPYGADPQAGQRYSSKLSRRRRNYRGAYGMGISRSPRKIISRRGRRMQWVGATAPYTRGGRRAHPPKSEKVWGRKMNAKEYKKALRSAIAATVDSSIVKQRGHSLPTFYPFVMDTLLEQIQKTKDLQQVFQKLQFSDELARTAVRKIQAGKAKRRGRKYYVPKGPLIVVSGDCPLLHAAHNIPGVEAVAVRELTISQLAPGSVPGRLTIWTEAALQIIQEEKLFL